MTRLRVALATRLSGLVAARSALYHGRDWVVDWSDGLTEAEKAFVRAHTWNFCVTYQADGREPREPPICREQVPGMGGDDDPIVVDLTAQVPAAQIRSHHSSAACGLTLLPSLE